MLRFRLRPRRALVLVLAALIALPQAGLAQAPAKPAAPQSATTKKLEQLKSLLNEGLITQAQYQKASTQVLNEMVQ